MKIHIVIDEGIWDGKTYRGSHIIGGKGFLDKGKAQAFALQKGAEAVEDEEGDPRVADRFRVADIQVEE